MFRRQSDPDPIDHLATGVGKDPKSWLGARSSAPAGPATLRR